MTPRTFTGLPDPVLPLCRRCAGNGTVIGTVRTETEVQVPTEVVTDGRVTVEYRTEWIPTGVKNAIVPCPPCAGAGIEPGTPSWRNVVRGVAHWLLAKANT